VSTGHGAGVKTRYDPLLVARNLRREPRIALAITPANNPFEPVVIRGQVAEWIEVMQAWEVIDRLATKYTSQP
jgi:hypothetical protein